jgi:hypothetical protein
MVVRIPMKMLTEPITIGAMVCIETGKLPCANDAVPEMVDKIIAGIVNQACMYENR